MPLPKEHAWFPCKSYGWGWGIPSRWQGWVVIVAYLIGLTAINLGLRRIGVVWHVSAVIGLTLLLIAMCYWKGEAPRWSWGGKGGRSDPGAKRS